MTRYPLFKDTAIGFQVFLFLAFLLFGALIGMLSGLVFVQLTQGMGLHEAGRLASDGSSLNASRIIQIATQLGLFICPPLAMGFLVSEKPLKYLGFNTVPSPLVFVPAIAVMFAGLPFIHWLSDLNKAINFPDWMAGVEVWMQNQELNATRLTKLFLNVDSLYGLAVNLFMIALIPAIGEELVFRSVLQPQMGKLFKNIHIGIFVSAILFSAMHFQFYGLLPRFILGLFLGYSFFWSGSIFVPMVMHFVNNGSAVIAYYLHYNGFIQTSMDDFGATSNPINLVLFTVITGLLLGIIWRFKRHH